MTRITLAWVDVLKCSPYLIKECGRYVITGDGVKVSKEGKKMPGVKKLHQESDNSSKSEYIHGQMFGGLGILAGNGTKKYCILLSLRLHDGISAIKKWAYGEEYNEESHVEMMINDAKTAVSRLGASILLLDRLFLTKPMLQALAKVPGLSVVTKAKSNATAFNYPEAHKRKGTKKGEPVKLMDYFLSHTSVFTETTLKLYGKDTKVRYFCINLLWGRGLYQPLQFVLTVLEDGTRSILVSTDLTLCPTKIIELYCWRFKIECSFREFKQVIAGFAYHFWSKHMPKLKKYKKNEVNQAILENISDPKHQKAIKKTVEAIEGFAQFSAIALGMLQLIGLQFGKEINSSQHRFMRTVSCETPSERTVADNIRKNIRVLFRYSPKLAIMSLISARQRPPDRYFSFMDDDTAV